MKRRRKKFEMRWKKFSFKSGKIPLQILSNMFAVGLRGISFGKEFIVKCSLYSTSDLN
jgi:hypothetical protein